MTRSNFVLSKLDKEEYLKTGGIRGGSTVKWFISANLVQSPLISDLSFCGILFLTNKEKAISHEI